MSPREPGGGPACLPAPHRGALPVQQDLWDVVGRVQQMVVPPLAPLDRHCAIFIHAGEAEGVKNQPPPQRAHFSLSPLQNLLGLLLRDVDSEVAQGQPDFLRVDPACATKTAPEWLKADVPHAHKRAAFVRPEQVSEGSS